MSVTVTMKLCSRRATVASSTGRSLLVQVSSTSNCLTGIAPDSREPASGGRPCLVGSGPADHPGPMYPAPSRLARMSSIGPPMWRSSHRAGRLPVHWPGCLPPGGWVCPAAERPGYAVRAAEPRQRETPERKIMSSHTGVERTLVLFKPDAVARGLVGRVLARFEDALLRVVAARMVWMDADLTKRHYFDLEERFGPSVYATMAEFMQSGPVIAVVLEGIEAVACVRKIVGPTYPDQAPPGTIRGDFAHMSRAYANDRGIAVANLVHASGNAEEAAYEIGVWFAKDEVIEYPAAES